MSTPLIWTPIGEVEPAAALAEFVNRTNCVGSDLVIILDQLWRKAKEFARRACLHVINYFDPLGYPPEVQERAHFIMKKVAQRALREPDEMVFHLEQCLMKVATSAEKSAKVIITLSEKSSTKNLVALINDPRIIFPDKATQTALIAATVSNNWNFTNNEVVVTVNIPDAYSAFMAVDVLVKVVTDFELVETQS